MHTAQCTRVPACMPGCQPDINRIRAYLKWEFFLFQHYIHLDLACIEFENYFNIVTSRHVPIIHNPRYTIIHHQPAMPATSVAIATFTTTITKNNSYSERST